MKQFLTPSVISTICSFNLKELSSSIKRDALFDQIRRSLSVFAVLRSCCQFSSTLGANIAEELGNLGLKNVLLLSVSSSINSKSMLESSKANEISQRKSIIEENQQIEHEYKLVPSDIVTFLVQVNLLQILDTCCSYTNSHSALIQILGDEALFSFFAPLLHLWRSYKLLSNNSTSTLKCLCSCLYRRFTSAAHCFLKSACFARYEAIDFRLLTQESVTTLKGLEKQGWSIETTRLFRGWLEVAVQDIRLSIADMLNKDSGDSQVAALGMCSASAWDFCATVLYVLSQNGNYDTAKHSIAPLLHKLALCFFEITEALCIQRTNLFGRIDIDSAFISALFHFCQIVCRFDFSESLLSPNSVYRAIENIWNFVTNSQVGISTTITAI